ncbi:MAG: molecular chaperone [Erythrobacter sp.]|nr:molecular chaperone [Erythrobacter sp.]
MAELLVAPTRVTLDERSRTAELVLVNRGEGPAAFRLSLENRRMREDGSLETVEEPLEGELFALDMLRFSPRQLLLEPGARQVVRIMAKSPAGLAPGEYRSHLRLMSAPASAARPAAEENAGDTSLSIELIAIRSITVPVILRVGKLEATASVDAAALSEAEPDQLAIKLTRSGTRSTYGDITITPEGAAEPVWTVRGVAIYTPNTSREAVLPLSPEVRAQLAGRKVRIAYVSSDDAVPEMRGKVLAELSLQL